LIEGKIAVTKSNYASDYQHPHLSVFAANVDFICEHCQTKILQGDLFVRVSSLKTRNAGLQHVLCTTCEPVKHMPRIESMAVLGDEIFLNKLAASGCAFVSSVPGLGGFRTVLLTPKQALKLVNDKQSLYAELENLSISEYLEWIEGQGTVYCQSQTSKGERCRNAVKGGTWLGSGEWKSLFTSGGYCSVHGG
jgi:hypothetical protein